MNSDSQTFERVGPPEGVPLPTKLGELTAYAYRGAVTRAEGEQQRDHLALVRGQVGGKHNVLVRIHSECVTGDVFGSLLCDCGEQLKQSMEEIAAHGGVVIYLRQEGRGAGLSWKLLAYVLMELGFDTVDAFLELGLPEDLRDYRLAAFILRDLGVLSARLLTNNPEKIESLNTHGVPVHERVPVMTVPNELNLRYVNTKRDRMGHLS